MPKTIASSKKIINTSITGVRLRLTCRNPLKEFPPSCRYFQFLKLSLPWRQNPRSLNTRVGYCRSRHDSEHTVYTHNIDDAIAYFDPTLELYNVAYDNAISL